MGRSEPALLSSLNGRPHAGRGLAGTAGGHLRSLPRPNRPLRQTVPTDEREDRSQLRRAGSGRRADGFNRDGAWRFTVYDPRLNPNGAAFGCGDYFYFQTDDSRTTSLGSQALALNATRQTPCRRRRRRCRVRQGSPSGRPGPSLTKARFVAPAGNAEEAKTAW